jgi:hypothetical protein
MKLFACGVCGQALMFENTHCESCGHRLGYDRAVNELLALEPAGESGDAGLWRPVSADAQARRLCANAAYQACNWLVDDGNDSYCRACSYNHMTPDLSVPAHVTLWREIEVAKHRLFYALERLRLQVPTRQEDTVNGLAFDVLTEEGGAKVLTGHDNGLITLNAAEADAARRESMRASMSEDYRTLIGHFRHEVGHYVWDRLVRDGGMIEQCRAIFGDERANYDEALKRHYAAGPPPGWRNNFVSAYATTHPWEDFAETFAHYLHIVDAMETARSFGLAVHPKDVAGLDAEATIDPYSAPSVGIMLGVWVPLGFAINALNRGMGQPDIYPFVLAPAVVRKLEFIHGLVHRQSQGERTAPAQAAA